MWEVFFFCLQVMSLITLHCIILYNTDKTFRITSSHSFQLNSTVIIQFALLILKKQCQKIRSC